jgi:Mycothiol maleylpyruvate isomerase N-terminal domain
MGWEDIRATFLTTAGTLPGLLARIEDSTAPGLGAWDIAGLTGHTLRAVKTVLTYLGRPEPLGQDLFDAADYYAAAMAWRDGDPAAADAAVAQRGADELAGIEPAGFVSAFEEAIEDASATLQAAHGFRLVASPFGSIRLDDYLRTRLLEITIHGIDLATAQGIDWSPPDEAVSDGLSLLTEVARRRGNGPALLVALTGRTSTLAEKALPVLR